QPGRSSLASALRCTALAAHLARAVGADHTDTTAVGAELTAGPLATTRGDDRLGGGGLVVVLVVLVGVLVVLVVVLVAGGVLVVLLGSVLVVLVVFIVDDVVGTLAALERAAVVPRGRIAVLFVAVVAVVGLQAAIALVAPVRRGAAAHLAGAIGPD